MTSNAMKKGGIMNDAKASIAMTLLASSLRCTILFIGLLLKLSHQPKQPEATDGKE